MLSVDGTFLVIFVSFFVFLLIMKGMFFEPIMKIKHEREGLVDSSREAADEAATKRARLSEEARIRLAEARRKAQQRIQEVRDAAKQRAHQQLVAARQEAADDMERRLARIQSDRQQVYQSLEAQRDEMSRLIVEKLEARQPSSAVR